MDDKLPVRVSIGRIVEWIAERNGWAHLKDAGLTPERCEGHNELIPTRVSEESAQFYHLAADELLEAIHAERLPILGQKSGLASRPLESVLPGEFSELHSKPHADTPLQTILGEGRYLDIDDGSIRSRSTVFWGRLVALRDDVLRAWPETTPTCHASSVLDIAKRPLKHEAVVAWLQETYPERPPLSVFELMRELGQKAPHLGNVSKRTFETALQRAYGRAV
jgi:hypothetical protein